MDNNLSSPNPINEIQRLEAVKSWGILDTAPSKSLDSITKLAAEICDTPIALISIVDEYRQWFKSKVNFEVQETPREFSFCQFAILGKDIYEIPDAKKDPLFSDNPYVIGNPHIRFYAAAPLIDPNGYALGALCVADQKPRKLNATQRRLLKTLSETIITNFALTKSTVGLQDSIQDLDNFFMLASDYMCIANMQGYFVKISSSFVSNLGYTEQELLENPFMSFVHPEDIEKTIQAMKDLNNGSKDVLFFMNRYRRRDGSYIWLSWNAYPQMEKGIILATARDISEFKKIQQLELDNIKLEHEKEIAEQKSKTRQDFLSTMSHEIRTPLNAIIGVSNLLKKKSDSFPEKIVKDIEVINLNSKNLLSIVNDILDYAKIDAGQIKLEEIEFDLKENLNSVVSSFINSGRSFNSTELKINFSQDLPGFVYSDPTRLNQILINLISNALKFTPKGSVTLNATVLNETQNTYAIEFSIVDTGIGVSREKQEVIFDAFTQASEVTTRLYGGTGLGLSIVKNLCKVFNSTINLISRPGFGSNFYFMVEFKKPTTGINSNSITLFENNVKKTIHILLVEDNEFNQMVVVDTISEWAKNVVIDIAVNGKIAIEKLEVNDYDLVLMDIQMPVMDGYEATSIIRHQLQPSKQNIPILGMSANAFIDDINKGIEVGMDDYIIKPFEADKLFEKINMLLLSNTHAEIQK